MKKFFTVEFSMEQLGWQGADDSEPKNANKNATNQVVHVFPNETKKN